MIRYIFGLTVVFYLLYLAYLLADETGVLWFMY